MTTTTARHEVSLAQRAPLRSSVPGRTNDGNAFDRHAAIGFWIASLPLLIGNMVDLATLWLLQRQSGPTWEFVAVGNTIDAYPSIALSVGLLFAAVYFQRWTNIVVYRVLATMLILLGLGAIGLGIVHLTDYLVLRTQSGGDHALLRSTMIKGVSLSGFFFLLLTGMGLVGLRRPRT